jgi:hypothetical protein
MKLTLVDPASMVCDECKDRQLPNRNFEIKAETKFEHDHCTESGTRINRQTGDESL